MRDWRVEEKRKGSELAPVLCVRSSKARQRRHSITPGSRACKSQDIPRMVRQRCRGRNVELNRTLRRVRRFERPISDRDHKKRLYSDDDRRQEIGILSEKLRPAEHSESSMRMYEKRTDERTDGVSCARRYDSSRI